MHLSQRWDYIMSLYESGKLEEETGSESQEVLEDILVRNLTKEYLEVIKVSWHNIYCLLSVYKLRISKIQAERKI